MLAIKQPADRRGPHQPLVAGERKRERGGGRDRELDAPVHLQVQQPVLDREQQRQVYELGLLRGIGEPAHRGAAPVEPALAGEQAPQRHPQAGIR